MKDLDVVEVSSSEWDEVEEAMSVKEVSMLGGKTRVELMECWGICKSRAIDRIKQRVERGLFEVGKKWVRNCLGIMTRIPAYRPVKKGKKP